MTPHYPAGTSPAAATATNLERAFHNSLLARRFGGVRAVAAAVTGA